MKRSKKEINFEDEIENILQEVKELNNEENVSNIIEQYKKINEKTDKNIQYLNDQKRKLNEMDKIVYIDIELTEDEYLNKIKEINNLKNTIEKSNNIVQQIKDYEKLVKLVNECSNYNEKRQMNIEEIE